MPGQDPESRKEEMLRKEEEELKAHVRREALKRKNKEKAHQRGLMSAYVDEEDNENTFSVNAIKNKIKPGLIWVNVYLTKCNCFVVKIIHIFF